MKIDYNVPFYPNTDDDTHCFQASLKSVLKYFLPSQDFSWAKLDKASAKVEGLWTWPMAGLIWMKKQGFEVRNIEEFDYRAFIDRGGDYLTEKYGSKTAAIQLKNSNVEQEKQIAKQFLVEIGTENRPAEIKDIVSYLKRGYLVGVNVNASSLNGREGYAGHFILVTRATKDTLTVHDPGLPPLENRQISYTQFDKGWAYPTPRERNLTAFRLSATL